jgi:hypothetical protein
MTVSVIGAIGNAGGLGRLVVEDISVVHLTRFFYSLGAIA